MNSPINSYPTEGSSNENVLFSTLGAFWTRVFQDKAALRGLSMAQSEEICQSYYNLLDAIDSYSANYIQIFKTVKWMPVVIKLSDLNANVLKFGEGVNYGAQVMGKSYYYGAPQPQEDKVYVVKLPDNLKQISIITNRVISPDFVLVNNLDVRTSGDYLYFYTNPFLMPNVSSADLIDEAGVPQYFSDPLTGQQIPDKLLILWAYNAKLQSESLNYNVAYLFGINIPPSVKAKGILEAMVKLCGNPSVQKLKAICGAFLEIKPILEAEETIEDINTTSTHKIVVTNKHTYRFDKYYSLLPSVVVGSKVHAGDVLVDAIEFYDAVVYKNWWLSKMGPRIAQITDQPIKSPGWTLPPYMFAGNQKYGLTFKNDMQLVTRDSSGYITFPVEGTPEDMRCFQEYINQPVNKTKILEALGGLNISSMKLVNPLDFLFTNLFQTNTAMVKINFKDLNQLSMLTQFFPVFKKCLPAHVYLLFFFDIVLDQDVYPSGAIDDSAVTGVGSAGSINNGPGVSIGQWPITAAGDGVGCNAYGSFIPSNCYVDDFILVRPVTPGITTKDYSLIDLTKDAHPELQI